MPIFPPVFNDLEKKPAAFVLIRLIVGSIFLSEGLQKFLFSESLGVGRFIKIGIPAPEIMAPFVGVVEIVCGTLLLVGLFSQIAAIPLIIDMLVAISTTKIPILLDKGFWAMAHEVHAPRLHFPASRWQWSLVTGCHHCQQTTEGSQAGG
jgi:uncharacterized membrane protein YphA (DoxX/SURF4 family)